MGEMPFKIKRASSVPISVVIDTGVNSKKPQPLNDCGFFTVNDSVITVYATNLRYCLTAVRCYNNTSVWFFALAVGRNSVISLQSGMDDSSFIRIHRFQ